MGASKKNQTEKQRRAAAYREAGHAVAAWHSGILLEALSINPIKRKYRENAWNNPLAAIDADWIRQERPETLIKRLALVSLAGPIVARQIQKAGSLEPISKERIQNADALLKYLPDSREKRKQQRRKLEAEAQKLLNRRDLRKKTERLAGVLADRGVISAKEATRILEETE